MRRYVIKRVTGREVCWDDITKGDIDLYPWGEEYMPEAYFRAVYIPNDGILVRLTCYESNPKAVYDNYMDPVYCDSCLEFFADYSGEKASGFTCNAPGYINCEINSKGTLLACIGKDSDNRTPLLQAIGELPAVTVYKDDKQWSVELYISFKLLKKLYKDTDFSQGHTFYGNVFKCGDECEHEHYGVWNYIENNTPNFHIPGYFGEFCLG